MRFCNEILPDLLIGKVAGAFLSVFTVVSPVERDEFLADTRESRNAIIAKCQAQCLISAGNATPLIERVRFLVETGSADLSPLLWTCENYDWETGTVPEGAGKCTTVVFSLRILMPFFAEGRPNDGEPPEAPEMSMEAVELRRCALAVESKYGGGLAGMRNFAIYHLFVEMHVWDAQVQSRNAHAFAFFVEQRLKQNKTTALKMLKSGLEEENQDACLAELARWFK